MSQQDLEQSATQNKLSTKEQLDIKVEPETHNDDTPHVHNMQQDTSTSQSSDGVAMHMKEEPAADVGYDEPAPLLVTQLMNMSQQDLEQSATQNKLSTMEQLDIKVEPETHNDDTPHVHNMQQDTFLTCNKKLKYESILHHEVFLKDDPDSDNMCSELIDDTQVMCASTSQSSDSVAMHMKEEPAADVGYDEPAPLLVTQLMDLTASSPSHLPVPMKDEVEDNVDYLRISSVKSEHKQQVVPSGLSTDDVCVSGNTYQCDECHKCFSLKYNLRRHIRTHTGEKPYKCDICDKRFNQSYNLRSHIRIHTKEKYKCNVCNKVWSYQKYFKNHMCTRMDEKRQCDMCNKTFSSSTYLKSHIRTHTGEKPYQCDVCNKTFSQQCHYKIHIRSHTGEKPYKCELCNKTYSKQSHLKRHIRSHIGEKPYKCDLCNKTFTQQCTLKIHLRIHTGDKPYKCDLCNKTFYNQSHLQLHIRTHTGEKPYKCDLCNKTFSYQSNVKIHMRTHTREKPYQCDLCKKTFSQKGNLKTHIRSHTGEKSYECDICNKIFSDKSVLRKHIRQHVCAGMFY